MKYITPQNGRTMIETLAVLGIIGVISLGIITGYTFAMNRYKAARLIDKIMQMSALYKTALLYNQTTTDTAGKKRIYDEFALPIHNVGAEPRAIVFEATVDMYENFVRFEVPNANNTFYTVMRTMDVTEVKPGNYIILTNR